MIVLSSSRCSMSISRILSMQMVLFISLCVYSIGFFTLDISPLVTETWIHHINVIVHQIWHAIVYPFWGIVFLVWGSIFQVVLPLMLTYIFLFRDRDVFGASVTLWWVWQNLIDMAPYINDVRSQSLPLLWGLPWEGYDWWSILSYYDLLHYDFFVAILVHYSGIVIMGFALVWGWYILVQKAIQDIISPDKKKTY